MLTEDVGVAEEAEGADEFRCVDGFSWNGGPQGFDCGCEVGRDGGADDAGYVEELRDGTSVAKRCVFEKEDEEG